MEDMGYGNQPYVEPLFTTTNPLIMNNLSVGFLISALFVATKPEKSIKKRFAIKLLY
jgi:hypothetical protein